MQNLERESWNFTSTMPRPGRATELMVSPFSGRSPAEDNASRATAALRSIPRAAELSPPAVEPLPSGVETPSQLPNTRQALLKEEMSEQTVTPQSSQAIAPVSASHAPVTLVHTPLKRPAPLKDQLGREVGRHTLDMATSQFSEGVPEWFLSEDEELGLHRGRLELPELLTEEGEETKPNLIPTVCLVGLISCSLFLYQYLSQL